MEREHAGVNAALLATKFNVTHYNHDPDTTFFNEQRIVLTTRTDRAGGRPYLKISNAPNGTDLGDLSNIDSGQLTTTINKLNSYLQRNDWPMAPNSSLQTKYYSGNTSRLTQLSLNIIDYVRSKESAKAVVVPLRGTYVNSAFTIAIGTDVNSYFGITRAPRITEVGLYIPPTPTVGGGKTYAAKLKVEIYLPKNFGIGSLDLTTLSMYQSLYYDDGGTQPHILPAEAAIKTSEISPSNPLTAGNRALITRTVNITYTNTRPVAESNALFRIALGLINAPGVSNRLDVAPLLDGQSNHAAVKVNAPSTPEANMPSAEVDDPRINSHKNDWKQVTQNTFGQVNSVSTLGKAPDAAIKPEQDIGTDGKVTDISLVIPAPSGSAVTGLSANPTGIMASAGELGYISTGMQSAGMAGAPWRTLHLQPSKQGTTVVPDWAFMDLFTVPADIPPDVAGKPSPKAIYTPHGTASGGRVNMNAKPEPFDLDRVDPLAAVFENATYDATDLTKKLSSTKAHDIAKAVYDRTLATASNSNSAGQQYGYQNGYDSPGEVVEMKGVADGGEASEQLVREISNLITARGNVFSVYTVGQALRQTPAAQLVVTGEQRQQSMLERYSDGAATPTIHFRPMYFRNLTP